MRPPVKPRVVIAAEHASAKFGGEAVLPLHYYRVLRARGIPVWLVVHERTREELAQLYPNDGEFILYIADTKFHKILWRISQRLPARLSGFTTGFLMRIATQLSQRRIVKDLVQREGITVIHQPMPVSPKEPSLIFNMGAPVVIGPMNGGMNYPPAFAAQQAQFELAAVELARSFANIMNRLLPGKRQAARLLVANERTKRALPKCLSGVPTEILVENGVDLTIWTPPPATNHGEPATAFTRFVYLGRLIDLKAVDLLLIAFAKASSKSPMSLEIIGDGVARAALENLALKMDVHGPLRKPGYAHFAGWLTQADCSARLLCADALILPSLMECGGAVVLEAMAMAMPVIATNWGGPADYLDSTCGILVDPASRESFIDDLASAMVKFAQSPETRKTLGQAGRKKIVEQFDWEVKVDRMLEIYDSVIQSRAVP